MKKSEFIAKHGEEAWEKRLEQRRVWHKVNRENTNAKSREWKEAHPDKVEALSHEQNRKGGKRYEKKRIYNQTGLQGERERIRKKHQRQYKPYKDIIAPDSQIHHEWIPKKAKYRGVALVEAKAHQYGIIDVIVILDGKITLLTEKDIREAC